MNQPRFKAEAMPLPGVVVITPRLYHDVRGTSVTVYAADEFDALGIKSHFVEDYTSRSKKNVLRGLHFQRSPYAQDKLVRCSQGEIFAVVADCNPSSASYRHHVHVTLSAKDQTMLFVPGTYAFGFCVTGEDATVEYKLSDTFHPESAGGVLYNDPVLAIAWPITEPILSEKDAQWPALTS